MILYRCYGIRRCCLHRHDEGLMHLLSEFRTGIRHFFRFGVAGGGDGGGRGGSVLRFLAPRLPVLRDRRLAGLTCVIHG